MLFEFDLITQTKSWSFTTSITITTSIKHIYHCINFHQDFECLGNKEFVHTCCPSTSSLKMYKVIFI